MFYPGDAAECRAMAGAFLQPTGAAEMMGRNWIGAIVPHAGWICSGAIAGEAIASVAKNSDADVVVIFGAVHTPVPIEIAALDTHGRWSVPGGESAVASELQAKLREEAELFVVDERFHQREHAVEVELPMVQLAFPNAGILPIEVPASASAVDIGRATARRIESAGLKGVYLASSDLTHYGPNYRFTPAGIGEGALEWAKENDRRLLRMVTEMAAERIVPETQSRQNACGGGAIAAMLAACREMGASAANVLRHANSCETLAKVAPQPPTNAVGYAGVVIGC
jgi:AmmeMemoRadiSam system protein B